MIKVCDAIMGSGKTSAAINYINDHPERHYLYISPFLEEAARIKQCCPSAHFIEPRQDIPKYHFRKGEHLAALAADGRNIASTHQSVMFYSKETLQALKDNDYCLIIDEEIEPLHRDVLINSGDIETLLLAGHLRKNDKGGYELGAVEYRGSTFRRMFKTLQTRELIEVGAVAAADDEAEAVDETEEEFCVDYSDGQGDSASSHKVGLWCWKFPIELLAAVADTFILTYMFADSDMDYYLRMNGLEYNYIGVSKTEDGEYHFSEGHGYVPEYVASLSKLINIAEKPRLNDVGRNKRALSRSWYDRGGGKYKENETGVERLNKNLNAFFNSHKEVPIKGRLCGSYAADRYWKALNNNRTGSVKLVFNSKSTNQYRDRTILAYPVNLYQNPSIVNFYSAHGFKYSHNRYALSTMIQWIWRSAIRDGKPIHIYIPSKRMRDLLTKWIEETSRMGVSET